MHKSLYAPAFVMEGAGVADPVQASMNLVLAHPGTSAAIVGSINPEHLLANVAAARRALA